MNILLLGGTADARTLASSMYQRELLGPQDNLIYSVAGLVRQPDVPCKVISGGFSQYGGLHTYLTQQAIDMVLDVTHPFAEKMSSTALTTANKLAIPCWRFHRAPWCAQPGDDWRGVKSWPEMVEQSRGINKLLVTVGQLTQSEFDALFAEQTEPNSLSARHVVYRTAAPARVKICANTTWLKAIGPFDLQSEIALMHDYGIEAVLTKNSGGNSTRAKLDAARRLGIPVFMLDRPVLPKPTRLFNSIETCLAALDKVL